LVKRLWEIKTITEIQYQELYAINERDPEGEYGRIGRSTQSDVFLKLNTITKTVGSSPRAIETIVRNFEDDLIDEDAFARLLGRFKKNPADYGYEISISQDDIDEMYCVSNNII